MNELPPLRPDWLRRMQRNSALFRAGGGVPGPALPGAERSWTLKRDRVLDAAFPLLADPYRYISRRCAALGTDLFETRLRLRPTICMRGADAARLFHDSDRFVRDGAVELQAREALVERAPIEALVAGFVREWEVAVPGWQAAGTIGFHRAIEEALTRAALAWAGIPLPAVKARRGLALRFDRDRAARIALRPIIAASPYFAFIVHALARYPNAADHLAAGRPGYGRAFVDEVRRFYPLLPPMAGRVRQDFEWRGVIFRRGRRVLLDVYGTNHHPEWWEQPEGFRPERFLGLAPNPWSFIPQGGGARGPGEAMTIALMEAATNLLARRMRYALPAQDLSVDFARVPALPRSGVVMKVIEMR